MSLSAQYAAIARTLAQRFEDISARAEAVSKMRVLARVEDRDVGFYKARVAAYLKMQILNLDQMPRGSEGHFRELLIASANCLMILPDEPGLGQSASRHGRPPPRSYIRPIPERD